MTFHLATNEELLILLKECFDEVVFDELLMRFLPLFKRSSQMIIIRDFEFDDYLQEARITLLYVIEKFDFSKQQFVAPYFAKAYENRLFNHRRNQMAQKRQQTESLISLNEPIKLNPQESSYLTYGDLIYEKSPSIDDVVIARDALDELAKKLSPFEKKVMGLRMTQGTYNTVEIAQLLNTDKRSVENALSRCRKKCKQYFRY